MISCVVKKFLNKRDGRLILFLQKYYFVIQKNYFVVTKNYFVIQKFYFVVTKIIFVKLFFIFLMLSLTIVRDNNMNATRTYLLHSKLVLLYITKTHHDKF